MSDIVLKFGGTSLATPELILNAAKKIVRTKKEYDRVVVVVSAMGAMTDELTSLAYKITNQPDQRELDMLLTVGERISMSLLSMALNSMGYPSISLTGSQSGIVTDTHHGNARIQNIEKDRFLKHLDAGKIVIIAGFQGISYAKEVTTLGRGGSDLTAVAIAVAIGAKHCDIYKDVEGVYTADPLMVPNAKKLDYISEEEMLELAVAGASVLHARAMELAKKNGILIQIRSSFSEKTGTFIKERENKMEEILVRAIACEPKQSLITLTGIPNRMRSLHTVFKTLAEEEISVDMITKNVTGKGTTDLSFTVRESDHDKAVNISRGLIKKVKRENVISTRNLAKISLVGVGMKSHSGVAAKLFEELSKHDIQIKMITTSDIKLSILVDEVHAEEAVRSLHDAFELDKGGIKAV